MKPKYDNTLDLTVYADLPSTHGRNATIQFTKVLDEADTTAHELHK